LVVGLPAGAARINASTAKSQGVELSLESHPATGLTAAAWVSWDDAQLTENFPINTSSIRGFAGDRLPFSARISGNLSLTEEFTLPSNTKALIGGSWSYMGDRLGPFVGPAQASTAASLPRQVFPSYGQVDLNAEVKHETWAFGLFVNNVADKRGMLNGGAGAFYPNTYVYTQPRTFGFTATKTF
jgi:hypothetical protein